MAFNENLANLVREVIARTHIRVEEKRMFGGLCFMANDKICIGVEKNRLMIRLDPVRMDEALGKEGCNPMEFTGKKMKGFVFVDQEVLNTNQEMNYWVDLALEYNSQAKISTKRKGKK